MTLEKKTILMWAVATLAASVAGCECPGGAECDDTRPGVEGGCCRENACDEGFTCIGVVCRSCGAPGLPCCYPDTALGQCDLGLRCRSAVGDVPEQCVACGATGQSCCNAPGMSPCGEGLACEMASSTCQSAAALCRPGPIENVGIEDANMCALRVLPVEGDTWEHRLECASSMLRAGEQVRELGAVTVDEPAEYTYCITRAGEGRRTVTQRAFGDYEAQVCMCGGEDRLLGCLRTPGPCPAP